MFKSWSFLKIPADGAAPPRAAPAASSAAAGEDRPVRLHGGGPLDVMGQQSESIRDRVNGLAERLHDVKTLSAEFDRIVDPLNGFLEQHAALSVKMMETEALLEREREVGRTARRELNELQLAHASVAGELQEVTTLLRDREGVVRQQELQLTEARIELGDLRAHADNLDSRLFTEGERSKALADEVAALRNEVAALDEARLRAEQRSAEAGELVSSAEAEISRLQHLAESLAHKAAAAARNLAELEPQLHGARAAAADLQIRLGAEQAARLKAETTRETERSTLEIEITSLSMKVEGLNAHSANTEKLLGHVREQLRGKTEALRLAEKEHKDAQAERAAMERRLDAALEAAARANAQSQEAQKANLQLRERCDMLNKAVAAKDQMLDIANRKSAGLLERIEQISARFQQERAEAEAVHRRLIEELQNERAERSLAHGALDIARKSRSAVMAQYTALKRNTGKSGPPSDEFLEIEDTEPVTSPSNVMIFAPPDEAGKTTT